MDYIFIQKHLDDDPKSQRFIRNRILYKTSDTLKHAAYKKRLNKSFDQRIHQNTFETMDASFYIFDKICRSSRRSSFSQPFSAIEKSSFTYKSLQISHSSAVKNIQRKIKNSHKLKEEVSQNKFMCLHTQYKFKL